MLDNFIIEKLKKVKLFATDVDGTLTDSAMYYSENGEELKRFSTRDGMGITLLRKNGIKTALITSELSNIAEARALKLKMDYCILGCRNKSEAITNICNELQIGLDETAYIGDDINDEHILKLSGFSACPNDAVERIKNIVDYKSNYNGGNGAVREICEMILLSQNKLITINENW